MTLNSKTLYHYFIILFKINVFLIFFIAVKKKRKKLLTEIMSIRDLSHYVRHVPGWQTQQLAVYTLVRFTEVIWSFVSLLKLRSYVRILFPNYQLLLQQNCLIYNEISCWEKSTILIRHVRTRHEELQQLESQGVVNH